MTRFVAVTVGAAGIVATISLGAGPALIAQAPPPGQLKVSVSRPTTLLPGTRPDILSIIQGNALTATNGPLPYTLMRLRDARMGRIVDTQITDRVGLFLFRSVEPGSYIVEAIGEDSSVLSASQMITVESGDTASAVVKLPFRIGPFGNLLGHSASSAAAVTIAAATSGVLATTITGEPVSP